MNNLFVALLLFAATSAFYLSQHAALSKERQSNQALATQLDNARAGLDALTQQVARAQIRLTERRDELAAAREDLARVAKAARAIEPPLSNPAAEGAWPAAKPYFYLLKKRLREVGYAPLRPDKHLSDVASTLFGMSPAEGAAVDNSIHRLREAVQQLQAAHAQLEPASPGQNSSAHQEITYRMPQLANEFNELELECEASIAAALGESRSSSFLEAARPLLEQTYGQYGNQAYSLTFYADLDDSGQVNHHLEFVLDNGSGKARYGYGVNFPLTPESPLWDYRHLFGQEPLIAPTRAPGRTP